MRKKNPSWEIKVLGENDITKEISHLNPTQQADYIRLQKMCETGGVWLDASIVCVKPIEDWVNIKSDEIEGFRVPFDGYTMESWAFAVPRDSQFCKIWFEEFRKALSDGVDKYCNSISTEIIPENDGLRNWMPYLGIHAAWRVAYHKLPDTPIKLQNACDGPLKYLCMHHGTDDSLNRSINSVISEDNTDADETLPNIIKLRGDDRTIIDPILENNTYNKNSLLAKAWILSNN